LSANQDQTPTHKKSHLITMSKIAQIIV
jgi:hypothetical protein